MGGIRNYSIHKASGFKRNVGILDGWNFWEHGIEENWMDGIWNCLALQVSGVKGMDGILGMME